MKILCGSMYFHPDHSGIALYSTDLSVFLAEKGHQACVVTGFSFYPLWEKPAKDKYTFFRKEKYRGVNIYRGYLYVPRRVTTVARILQELTFLLFAAVNFIRAGRQDVIVILSPPLLLGLIGVIFKKLWGAKLIFHIQDFQLDAALSLGMLRKSPFIRMLEKIERFTFKQSDLIVPITSGMQEVVRNKGVQEARTLRIHNWIDVKEAAQQGRKGVFIRKYPELKDKFIVAYAGNIGIKQGIDIMIDLAEETSESRTIHYLIIGEGADKARLMERAERIKRGNLTLLSFIEMEEYFDMLHDIDVAFISQKSGTGNIFFPSKILGLMAQSKPVLVSADIDSELSHFVKSNGCGLVAAAGDVAALGEHVIRMFDNPEELAQFKEASFEAVMQFDREEILARYLGSMEKLARGNSKDINGV